MRKEIQDEMVDTQEKERVEIMRMDAAKNAAKNQPMNQSERNCQIAFVIMIAACLLISLLLGTACVNKDALQASQGDVASEGAAETESELSGSIVIYGTDSAYALMDGLDEFVRLLSSQSPASEAELMYVTADEAREAVATGEADIAIYDDAGSHAYGDEDGAEADAGATIIGECDFKLIVSEDNPQTNISYDEIVDLLTDQSDIYGDDEQLAVLALPVLPEEGPGIWDGIELTWPIRTDMDGDMVLTLPSTVEFYDSQDELVREVDADASLLGLVEIGTDTSGTRELKIDGIAPGEPSYSGITHMLYKLSKNSKLDSYAPAYFKDVEKTLRECGFRAVK